MISFAQDCLLVRRTSPIIHNITNYVAMNLSANALLAIGASPLMSSEKEEMIEIVRRCDALVINLGCLEKPQADAMRLAAETAGRMHKPWVLDPAGVGISCLRTETAGLLVAQFHPAVIRGNASEIKTLSGERECSRGLDSLVDSPDAVEHAVSLARSSGAVVVVSGPVDYITDGTRVISVSNGSPLMSKVTAMGCTSSALVGAFLAVDEDPLHAASAAMALMGVAGGRAAACSRGPGSMVAEFLDFLAGMDPEEASKSIRYEQLSA